MTKHQLYDCTCPTNCESATLPAVSFADCAFGVTDELSEIGEIFLDDLTMTGGEGGDEFGFANLPTDVTGAAPGWYGSAKRLYVIGDLPASEGTTRTLPKGWVKKGNSTWTLTADIMDATDENYAFVRSLQCGQRVGLAWKTNGGYVYGSVVATVTSSDWVLARGEDTYAIGQIVLTFKGSCLPTRAEDPEAEMAA